MGELKLNKNKQKLEYLKSVKESISSDFFTQYQVPQTGRVNCSLNADASKNFDEIDECIKTLSNENLNEDFQMMNKELTELFKKKQWESKFNWT